MASGIPCVTSGSSRHGKKVREVTYYIIDTFDPKTKRYRECYRTHDRLQADKMMSKPYHARHTRRLVEVSRTVLSKKKGRTK